MIKLQHWNKAEWITIGSFITEAIAWATLGEEDDTGYRTVNAKGRILTDRPPQLMDDNPALVSDCCGTAVLGEGEGGEICSDCNEHCEGGE